MSDTEIAKKAILALIKKIMIARKAIKVLDTDCDKLLVANNGLITDSKTIFNKNYESFTKEKFVFNINRTNLIDIMNVLENNDKTMIDYYAYKVLNEYKRVTLYANRLTEFKNNIKTGNNNVAKINVARLLAPNVAIDTLSSRLAKIGYGKNTCGLVGLNSGNGVFTLRSFATTGQQGGGLVHFAKHIMFNGGVLGGITSIIIMVALGFVTICYIIPFMLAIVPLGWLAPYFTPVLGGMAARWAAMSPWQTGMMALGAAGSMYGAINQGLANISEWPEKYNNFKTGFGEMWYSEEEKVDNAAADYIIRLDKLKTDKIITEIGRAHV